MRPGWRDRRRRLALQGVLLGLLSTSATSGRVSDCEGAAPVTWSKAQRARLCAEAGPGAGPGVCAQRVKDLRVSSLNVDSIIELCRAATGEGPALCAHRAPRSLSSELRMKLCRSASSSAPADCFKSAPARLRAEAKVDLCSGSVGLGAGRAECFNAFPRRFGDHAAIALCRTAEPCDAEDLKGACLNPARCASARGLEQGVSVDVVLRLCHQAPTDAPGLCYAAAPMDMSIDQKVSLCSGASSAGPAKCAKLLHQLSMQQQFKDLTLDAQVTLCRGSNNTGPADCLTASPMALSLAQKSLLCLGAVDSSPARCITRAQSSLRDMNDRVELCRGATDDAPAVCAAEAPYAMDGHFKALLCRGMAYADAYQPHTAPARCAKAVASTVFTAVSGWGPVLELCERATSEQPAGCFRDAPGHLPLDVRVHLCRGAGSTGPAVCAARAPRSLPTEQLVALCRGAQGEGPALCALSAAPLMLSAQEIVILCHDAAGLAPAACVKDAPSKLSASSRVTLCQGATDSTPALCALLLPPCFTAESLLAVCHGATSLTPAHCASSLPTCSPTPADVHMCRTSYATPSGLRILNVTRDSTRQFVQPGTGITATLVVEDQFNQPYIQTTSADLRTTSASKGIRVRAWCPSSHGSTIRLTGATTNTTTPGPSKVTIGPFSLDQPGSYTVHFGLGGEDGGEYKSLASVRVTVYPSEDEQRRLDCLFVFDLVREVGSEDERGRLAQRWAGVDSGAFGVPVRGVIVWPDSLRARDCIDVFESSAFQWAWGWYGEIWVEFSSGVYVVETGEGVPTAHMNYWERLGVKAGVTIRELRRAYYAKSLRWHPDRWSRYPEYVDRARKVFELVSEAYEGLMMQKAGQRGGGEKKRGKSSKGAAEADPDGKEPMYS